jgi:hypothetical protein
MRVGYYASCPAGGSHAGLSCYFYLHLRMPYSRQSVGCADKRIIPIAPISSFGCAISDPKVSEARQWRLSNHPAHGLRSGSATASLSGWSYFRFSRRRLLLCWSVSRCRRRAQAEGPVGREPQAAEPAGGDGAGCGDAEGDAGKKLLTPRVQRVAVSWAIKDWG